MAKLEINAAGAVGGGTPVAGSGTANTVAKWTGPNTLGDSVITSSAAGLVTIGAAGSVQDHVIRGVAVTCTTAAAADSFSISKGANSGTLYLIGGLGIASAHIILYGSAHATKPEAVEIANNNGVRIAVNQAGKVTLQTASTTEVLRINSAVTAAGSETGTLENSPTEGDPAVWLNIDVNGTTRMIPCWATP